jgi:hypothetical protein
VRWYRYKLGATPADQYCGVYWTRLYADKNDNKLKEKLSDENNDNNQYALSNLRFTPDVSYQTE